MHLVINWFDIDIFFFSCWSSVLCDVIENVEGSNFIKWTHFCFLFSIWYDLILNLRRSSSKPKKIVKLKFVFNPLFFSLIKNPNYLKEEKNSLEQKKNNREDDNILCIYYLILNVFLIFTTVEFF